MRRAAALSLLLVSFLVGLVAPAAAGTSDTVVSPGTRATYQRTVTCATNSLTVRADLRQSLSASGVDLTVGGFDGADGAVEPVTFPLRSYLASRWVSSTDVRRYTTADTGIASPLTAVGPEITTAGCPDYLDPTLPALVYQPLEQTRVLDTRPESRVAYPGPKPAAGALVPVLWSTEVAARSQVRAVVLNLTATEATAAGYVQAVPIGLASIGSSSNLNVERPGQTIANLAVVPVAEGGGPISLFTQSGTHLVADLLGVFVTPAAPTVPEGRYVGLDNPVRVLDTRPEFRFGWSGAKPGAGSSVPFSLDEALGEGLPREWISSVVLNVTLTEASGPGFVTVYPANVARPNTSNLNVDRPGQTIPNLVIVPVAAAEEAGRVFTQSGGHVIVDVIGGFTAPTTPLLDGGLFVPVPPERVLDTRIESAVNWDSDSTDRGGAVVPGSGTKPQPAELVPVYFDGLPFDAAAVIVNLTGTEATQDGFVQAAGAASLLPGASSNLNLVTGQTIPNAAVVPLDSQLAAGFFTSGGTHLVVDLAGFFTL
jgi:hypothetical protein